MATKTISIDTEAYKRLRARKTEGESFSQTIKRLVPEPFDVVKWLNDLPAEPVSDQFIAAVEETIVQRQASQNMKDFHDVPRHDRAGGSAKAKKSEHRRAAELKITGLSKVGAFLFTTRINVAEILVGAYRGVDPPNELIRINQVLQPISILDFDENSADRFARIKADTLRLGKPVGDADLLIAAIAQVNYCSLLTRNPRHFENFAGLKIESY